MRISELSTDKASDVLCELLPYVSDIASDEDFINILKDMAETAGKEMKNVTSLISFGTKIVNKVIPFLLKEKKNSVVNILAILNEKTPEEILHQNILVTMKQIKVTAMDKDFIDFFRSSVGVEGGE